MIKIYGASDDLIEVKGDLNEEYGCFLVGGILKFSDGTLLEIEYNKGGIWKIKRICKGTAKYFLEFRASEKTGRKDGYSDIAVLDGDIDWVTFIRGKRKK